MLSSWDLMLKCYQYFILSFKADFWHLNTTGTVYFESLTSIAIAWSSIMLLMLLVVMQDGRISGSRMSCCTCGLSACSVRSSTISASPMGPSSMFSQVHTTEGSSFGRAPDLTSGAEFPGSNPTCPTMILMHCKINDPDALLDHCVIDSSCRNFSVEREPLRQKKDSKNYWWLRAQL